METPPPPLKSVIIVFVFFMMLLLAWFTYSAIGVAKAMQAKRWPTVQGTVLSTEVKRGQSSKGSSKYIPVIRYSYEVDSAQYLSEKYSSTTARGSSMWAKEVVSQFPAYSKVTVHYNPENPKESILKPGLQSDDYWMTSLSGFFFAVVLLAFVQQLKKYKTAGTGQE